MKTRPKWPFGRIKKHFLSGSKVSHIGLKYAPGTPGIPKKFQVFALIIERVFVLSHFHVFMCFLSASQLAAVNKSYHCNRQI